MSLETLIGSREFEKMTPIKINEVQQYKNSWLHYIPEIVEVIRDLKTKGIFAYNSTVAENCKHLNIDKDVLDHFVYTSQRYLHNKADFDLLNTYHKKYEDWQELDEKTLKEYSSKKTYVMVVDLGKEPFKARPFYDAENKLFWMKPRFTRKGYRLNMPKIKMLQS